MTDALLDEYALIPDIFDPAAYSNPDFADLLLPTLKATLYRQALVRDLHGGAWSHHCQRNAPNLHRLTKELLRKLKNGNRLLPATACGANVPADAVGWCNEALSSHASDPLNGIICAYATKQQFDKRHEIASIERLASTPWWRTGNSSAVLDRKTVDYIAALSRILRQANSLMFIDPYLDPSESSFQHFYEILLPLSGRDPAPRIEIHRTCYRKVRGNRVFPKESDWSNAFHSLHKALCRARLSAEVFFWSEFHDRHLITDVVGIHAGAGFDVTSKPHDLTTWACLGREDRDKIQRQYDPAARPDALRHRFAIGHDSNGN